MKMGEQDKVWNQELEHTDTSPEGQQMRDTQKRWRVSEHGDVGEAGVSHPLNQEDRGFPQAGSVD